MNINNYFDKILIINLDESKDRWDNIVKELNKVNIINYERVPGVRLKNLEGIPPSYYKNLVSHQKINDYYKVGIVGANTAHINCIKLAKERGYKNILILEDDISFRDDIHELFEKVSNQIKNIDWGMLYLGSATQPKESIINVSENLIKASNLLACHAYAVNSIIYNKIIDEGLEYGAELDNFYKFIIQAQYNCLCTRPRLIWQNNGISITLNGFRDTANYTKD